MREIHFGRERWLWKRLDRCARTCWVSWPPDDERSVDGCCKHRRIRSADQIHSANDFDDIHFDFPLIGEQVSGSSAPGNDQLIRSDNSGEKINRRQRHLLAGRGVKCWCASHLLISLKQPCQTSSSRTLSSGWKSGQSERIASIVISNKLNNFEYFKKLKIENSNPRCHL